MASASARRWFGVVARVVQLPITLAIVWVAWREPRGFAFGSREFFAHQLLLPGLALTAGIAALAPRRLMLPAVALEWGFFLAPAVLLLTLADAGLLRGAGALLTLAALGVFGVGERGEGAMRSTRRACFGAGLLGGALFVFSMRAPSASTQPRLAPGRAPALTTSSVEQKLQAPAVRALFEARGVRISLNDGVLIERSGRSAWVQPGLRIDSASRHCLWSIVDYEHESLSAWRVAQIDERSWLIGAESRSVVSRVLISIDEDRVTLKTADTLKREVCVHLAQVLSVSLQPERFDTGRLAVAGHSLRIGDLRRDHVGAVIPRGATPAPRESLAWRHGEFALLRAASHEKGPFETLALLPDGDPVFSGYGFKLQVNGFAKQASRAASPTAGWGVSQGAIEAAQHGLSWELAATSLGRGWSTVRLAPGTYELTLTLDPAS